MSAAIHPAAIAVAPNGARKTKADHPVLPLSPAEIADETERCIEAGATLVHLHVRDAAGEHTLGIGYYRDAIEAIRKQSGERVLIQITTEAVGRYTVEEQMALVRKLVPQAVSLALRELIPGENAVSCAAHFYTWLRRRGIGVQHIVYSADEAKRLVALARRGVLANERPHALFVLGRYVADRPSEPPDLMPFLADWPEDWPWSCCAFGANEARCIAAALALGGHARVGFENNCVLPNGAPAHSNADLVKNTAELAVRLGRPVSALNQAREIYQIGD